MADADEDLIPTLAKPYDRQVIPDDENASESSADSDNAAPDYRFLTTTTTSSSSRDKNRLPARGTKDFEPNPTARQASTLDLSRGAMTDALSHVRTHTTKSGMVGVYFPDEAAWDGKSWDLIESTEDGIASGENEPAFRKSGGLRPGEGRCVAVEKFTSTYSKTMGQGDRRNWTWLLPEEALFLLDRGTLDIRWAATDSETGDDEEVERYNGSDTEQHTSRIDEAVVGLDLDNQPALERFRQHPAGNEAPRLVGGIPMSLQGAYATLIGKSGLTLGRYTVYANLKRAGYIVQRAPTWHGPVEDLFPVAQTQQSDIPISTSNSSSLQPSSSILLFLRRLFSWLFSPTPPKPISTPCFNSVSGPLISPGLFRSYGDIYRQLFLIPYHKYQSAASTSGFTIIIPPARSPSFPAETPTPTSINTEPPLFPTYHLYKPALLSTYRKSAPPPPSFHLVVIDSRSPDTSTIPTSQQIGDLLDRMPQDALSKDKRLETRIKHGTRNCLIAVIDSGLISYLRISGGGFTDGGLWEENEKRKKQTTSGKRGSGQRGGRGRGRGRGRGA